MLNLGALPPIRNAPRPEARQKLSRAFDTILPCIEGTDFEVHVCYAAVHQCSKHVESQCQALMVSRFSHLSQTSLQLSCVCEEIICANDGSTNES
jgi:hypothetical protein